MIIFTTYKISVFIIHIYSGLSFLFLILFMVWHVINVNHLALKIKCERKLLNSLTYIVDSVKKKIEKQNEPIKEIRIEPVSLQPRLMNSEVMKKIAGTGAKHIKLPAETYEKNKQTVFIIVDNKELILHIYKCMSLYFNIFYAANGIKALDKRKEIPKPDIIIYNCKMDIKDSYEFYDNLLKDEKFKDIPLFLLTPPMDQKEKINAFKKGIIDVIHKPVDMEELAEKVRSFLSNRRAFTELQRKRLERKISLLLRKTGDDEFLNFEKKCSLHRISPREKSVLREILLGLQTKEIAVKLFISIHTVKKHIRTIYKKCNVQNRVELVNCFKS